MIKCTHFWVRMNDISHVMKKHQQPVTESQTLDGASCYSSQRSKVVAAVGRLLLRASLRFCCRVQTTRQRQAKLICFEFTQLGYWSNSRPIRFSIVSNHHNLNPIPTRLCHVIYCHNDKSYPCLVGIGLSILSLKGLKMTTWIPFSNPAPSCLE